MGFGGQHLCPLDVGVAESPDVVVYPTGVKRKPGGRNGSPSDEPKARRSEASESGES